MLDAANFCESMATELLAIASSMEGAARLLTSLDRRQMTLLDVLIEQEQKEVISQPLVQRYLQVKSLLNYFFNASVNAVIIPLLLGSNAN